MPKTLFGDLRNCCVVALLIVSEVAMIQAGWAQFAPFVLPPLTLAGIFWLARSWRPATTVPPSSSGGRPAAHEKMLTFRLRSISHIDATATMLSEPTPRTNRG